MSFKDFNDEGPGTFGWDFVLGGNTTGLFPDETYIEVDGDTVTEVTYSHTGGGKYEPVRINTYKADQGEACDTNPGKADNDKK